MSSRCPTPTSWSPARPNHSRSRSSCAATSPVSPTRRCGVSTTTGARTIYGHHFPDGLAKNTPLPEPIVTPTTKAEHGGHDEPITCDEVVTRGLLDAELWAPVMAAALEVFHRGPRVGREAGLILADTKYEFGLATDDSLMLIDEMHTPDSSRWWVADTLRRPARRRRGTGEPRQGGRPAGLRRDRLPRRRSGADAARRRVVRDLGALHRRLRAPHRRCRSSPARIRSPSASSPTWTEAGIL